MVSNPAAQLDQEFGSFPALIAGWGAYQPDAPALFDGASALSWRQTADKVERIAARLQADGLQRGQAVARQGDRVGSEHPDHAARRALGQVQQFE